MTETPLVLTPPSTVPAVSAQQALASTKVDAATQKKIEKAVTSFVDSLTGLDPISPAFEKKVESISQLGNHEIKQSALVSNRFTERPTAALERGPLSAGSAVSTSLVALRRQVEDLDPSKHTFAPVRILGIFPFGNRVRDYFHKYESSQKNIDGIIRSLNDGQDELMKDNSAIDQEKVNIWAMKDRLEQYAYMTQKLDESLTTKIEEIRLEDPDKAKSLDENVLFYIRQKRQDILTQLAVNMQGYLALDIVRKNNAELVKGVDRATTTTVSALRTAVMVAQALNNQKLVLDQITALNSTTGNLIEGTSQMLKDQSASIQKQAVSTTVNVDQLQKAFNNIYATMDAIDNYKIAALDSMKVTVDSLSGQVEKAQVYVEHSQQAELASAATDNPLTLTE